MTVFSLLFLFSRPFPFKLNVNVVSTNQKQSGDSFLLSFPMWIIYLNVSAPLCGPACERLLALITKIKESPPWRSKRSNCPRDPSANTTATFLRHPEEDSGLCSLRKKGERLFNACRNNCNIYKLASVKRVLKRCMYLL